MSAANDDDDYGVNDDGSTPSSAYGSSSGTGSGSYYDVHYEDESSQSQSSRSRGSRGHGSRSRSSRSGSDYGEEDSYRSGSQSQSSFGGSRSKSSRTASSRGASVRSGSVVGQGSSRNGLDLVMEDYDDDDGDPGDESSRLRSIDDNLHTYQTRISSRKGGVDGSTGLGSINGEASTPVVVATDIHQGSHYSEYNNKGNNIESSPADYEEDSHSELIEIVEEETVDVGEESSKSSRSGSFSASVSRSTSSRRRHYEGERQTEMDELNKVVSVSKPDSSRSSRKNHSWSSRSEQQNGAPVQDSPSTASNIVNSRRLIGDENLDGFDASLRSRGTRSSKSSSVRGSSRDGSQSTRVSSSKSENESDSAASSSKREEHQELAAEGPVSLPSSFSQSSDGSKQRPSNVTSNASSSSQAEKTSSLNPIAATTTRSSHHVNGYPTRPRSIAVLGTMSDAGKSVLAAAICRILVNGGKRVAPFKAQNMSNNASPALLPDPDRQKYLYKAFERAAGGPVDTVTPVQDQGYGEIGTAQSLQAEACKIVPRVEMNPVLLKSGGRNEKGEWLCSVVVLGKQMIRETYGSLRKRTGSLQTMVLDSHRALADVTGAEVIVIEGAGSCTELNLMDRDIVNLPLVRALECPWLLVANIDCGGVFAQIVGTKMCCSERDWKLCVGVIVNKLRGEPKYFEPGPTMLERMVGKPIYVVPFLNDLNLPEEDGLGIERRLAWEKSQSTSPDEDQAYEEHKSEKKPVVVVVAYPHTAIADDLCPLEQDVRFHVEWRRKRIPKPYPHTTAVVLPGSRLTLADLKWICDSGWLTFIRKHVAAGGNVLGLCGGYQMLGWQVSDPDAVEGPAGTRQGIGLLPINTTVASAECKVVTPRSGQLYPSGVQVEGFELHCGISEVLSEKVCLLGKNSEISPLLALSNGKPEGMQLGHVRGTYLHGILRSDKARIELLVPKKKDFPSLKTRVPVVDSLDKFASHLSSCGLDFQTLSNFAGLQSSD